MLPAIQITNGRQIRNVTEPAPQSGGCAGEPAVLTSQAYLMAFLRAPEMLMKRRSLGKQRKISPAGACAQTANDSCARSECREQESAPCDDSRK